MSCNKNFSRFNKEDRSIAESHVNLQTHKNKNILTRNYGPGTGEKASVFASFVGGSFTVEASVILTVFILSVYGFLYLFLVFRMQVTILQAAEQASRTVAGYAYVEECLTEGVLTEDIQSGQEWTEAVGDALRWGIGTEILRQNVIDAVSEEYPDGSCVKGGTGGIRFLESSILEEDGIVDVVTRYDVEIPIGFPGMTRFQFIQRSRKRGWVGRQKKVSEEGEEETQEWAYVTETGSVYHLYEDCTHIRLSIQDVAYSQVDQYRNENGGKYKPCEKCCHEGTTGASVYIAKDGDRYHSTLGCGGLKRQVKKVPKNEVEIGMRLCGRCRARQQKEQ